MKNFLKSLREILKYPSAIFGSIIVLGLVIASVVIVIKIPYNEAINKWRGGEEEWGKNPRNAPPAWTNWFTKEKLVESLDMKESDEEGVLIEEIVTEGGTPIKTVTFSFDFEFDKFPQDIYLYFTSTFDTKQPFVSIKMITPDETEIKIDNFAIGRTQTFPITQSEKLQRRLGVNPNIGLFIVKGDESQTPVKGTYQLVIESVVFEENSTVESEFVLFGQVFGWAGTDHLRRDLTLPLLWGTPIALVFGLLAALGTSVLTMIIAAVGTWYGGFVDGLIQRITEINLVLPFLSILIMIGTFYSRSLWVILGATIALSIFTGGIKSYRAIFMQIKEATYIEAAKAYGTKDGRIIFKYLIPRIIPLLLPGLISAVPGFVFLEASLALLGIGDPVIPTWGKTINEAYSNAALYRGWYYWILEPAALLLITGLGFAMLGFAMDRVFNPRLRGM